MTDDKDKKSPETPVTPGTPETPAQSGGDLPPAPGKKNKGGRPKGFSPGKKKPTNIKEIAFLVPLQVTLINLTSAIASRKNDARYVMTQDEAKNIEESINNCLTYYMPLLEKYYPLIALGFSIGSYALRVSITPAIPLEPPKEPVKKK